MTWDRKEKEGPPAHLDVPGLLDLTESLEVPEVPATQVSTDFTTLKAGNMTLSMALTYSNHLRWQKSYLGFCTTIAFIQL